MLSPVRQLTLCAMCAVLARACDNLLLARRFSGIKSLGTLVMAYEGTHSRAPFWAAMSRASDGEVHSFYLYYLHSERMWALGNALGGSTVLAGIRGSSRSPEGAAGRWSVQQRAHLRRFHLPGEFLPGRMEPTDAIHVHCDPQIRSMRSLPPYLRLRKHEHALLKQEQQQQQRLHTFSYPEADCSSVHCPKLRPGCYYKPGPLKPSGCPRFPCKYPRCTFCAVGSC
jgi:hypothetical protein